MSILRRKPRKPRPVSGPVTLEMRPKDRRGATSRYRVVKVEAYTEDVPRVRVWIQDQSMGVTLNLDEEEVGRFIDGPREALQAAKANAASRESQEAGQDG